PWAWHPTRSQPTMAACLDGGHAVRPVLALLALALPTAEPDESLARQACVRVRSAERFGSGAVVARRDGYLYVLTANHVVANVHDIQVHTFPAGDKPGPVLSDA